MLLKLFLIAFAVIVIVRIYKQYRAQKVAAGWFLLWMVFWALVILVAFSPQTTDVIAQLVGVGRGADLMVYISLPVLFYTIFRLAARQDQHHKELTELVRKIAIDRAQEPEKK